MDHAINNIDYINIITLFMQSVIKSSRIFRGGFISYLSKSNKFIL